jgi:uncharacterized phage-associated protein
VVAEASDIALALRARLPGLPQKKLHKLLYYCQGHHLAALGEPLFKESISAWDMGPVVGSLWKAEQDGGPGPGRPLDERALNTVGYVVSRYGKLSGRDLEILTHNEAPWLKADETREPHGSVRIEQEWLVSWFRDEEAEPEAEQLIVLDEQWRDRSRARALEDQRHPDTRESLLTRLRS